MTIDEFKKNIAPYMRHGWVFMEQDGAWEYSRDKPKIIYAYLYTKKVYCWDGGFSLEHLFDIEPVDNWKESLIEVGQ